MQDNEEMWAVVYHSEFYHMFEAYNLASSVNSVFVHNFRALI